MHASAPSSSCTPASRPRASSPAHLLAAPVGTLPDAADLLLPTPPPQSARRRRPRGRRRLPPARARSNAPATRSPGSGSAARCSAPGDPVAASASPARRRRERRRRTPPGRAHRRSLHRGPASLTGPKLRLPSCSPRSRCLAARETVRSSAAGARGAPRCAPLLRARRSAGWPPSTSSQFADLAGATPEERSLLALLGQRGRYHSRPLPGGRRLRPPSAGRRRAVRRRRAWWEPRSVWVLAMMVADRGRRGRGGPSRRSLAGAAPGHPRTARPSTSRWSAQLHHVLAWRTGDVADDRDRARVDAGRDRGTSRLGARGGLAASTATNFACFTAIERRDLAPRPSRCWPSSTRSDGGIRVVPEHLWLHEVRSRVALASDEPHAALRELDDPSPTSSSDAGVDPADARLAAAGGHRLTRALGDDDAGTAALSRARAALPRAGAPPATSARRCGSPPASSATPSARPTLLADAIEVLEDARTTGSSTPRRWSTSAETWRAARATYGRQGGLRQCR